MAALTVLQKIKKILSDQELIVWEFHIAILFKRAYMVGKINKIKFIILMRKIIKVLLLVCSEVFL
jgi:hypothetical protein